MTQYAVQFMFQEVGIFCDAVSRESNEQFIEWIWMEAVVA
jgi:hypothetical protein